MKKLIALLLSAVLLLSAIPMVGAASFKDSADVTFMNVEAVDIMSDLKVVAGFPEGDFKPNDTLTRAQAAKILCCVVLGNANADALAAGGSTFTDVAASHWANKFVEYCASKGIVAGVGSGKFDPNGKLTGHAFGKMLLVALGSDASKFSGAGWDKAVAEEVHAKHLDYGVEVTGKEISRQDACRLALNALFCGEAEDPMNTLAYKAFGVIRNAAKTANTKFYKRPRTTYTSNDDGAYWEGTAKTVTASPAYVKEDGAVRGGELVNALGVEIIELDKIVTVRNGATGSKLKENRFKTGNKKVLGFTADGVRLEVYPAADTGKYTLIHLWYVPWKIMDVVEPSIGEDGTVETPGIVMFDNGKTVETNDYTKADVGNYILTYSTGKSRSKPTTPVELFRGETVTGKLEALDAKKGVTIAGKTYKFPAYLTDNSGMKTYLENGGAIGDEVKLLISEFNYAIAMWK